MSAGRVGRLRIGRLRVGGGLAIGASLGTALIVAAASMAPGSGARKPSPTPVPTLTVGPSPSAFGPGVIAGRVSVSPLTIALDIRVVSVRRERLIEAVATVTNVSLATLERLIVVIDVSPEGLSIKPGRQQSVRRVGAGASATVSWLVCGQAPGTYVATASVTVGASTVASAPRELAVTAETTC